jgi:hypothetical protein
MADFLTRDLEISETAIHVSNAGGPPRRYDLFTAIPHEVSWSRDQFARPVSCKRKTVDVGIKDNQGRLVLKFTSADSLLTGSGNIEEMLVQIEKYSASNVYRWFCLAGGRAAIFAVILSGCMSSLWSDPQELNSLKLSQLPDLGKFDPAKREYSTVLLSLRRLIVMTRAS